MSYHMVYINCLLYTDASTSSGYCPDMAFWYFGEYGTDRAESNGIYNLFLPNFITIFHDAIVYDIF